MCWGREVYQPVISSSLAILNVSFLNNGIYFYQISNDKETLQGRFAVEK